MSKAWVEYSNLQKYAEDEKKRREALQRAKDILKGNASENDASSGANGGNASETEKKPDEATVEFEGNSFKYPDELDINFDSSSPLGELEKIDEFYKNKKEQEFKPNLGLEELEMPTQTEQDTIKGATLDMDSKYAKLKQNELDEFERNSALKEQQKEIAKEYASANETKVNKIYDASVVSAENQALKRGLARSSIIIGQLDGIEKGRAQELSKVATDLTQELSNLDQELASLNTKKDNALEILDIDYASELQGEIEKRLTELDKKKKEITEFNNKVKQLEGDYQMDRNKELHKQEMDNAEFKQKYGQSASNSDEQASVKMMYMMDYLNKMPRNDALKKLTSDSMFAYYLGDKYMEVYNLQLARPLN